MITIKKLTILALHLSYGGVEKAVSSFANIMAERYDVNILSVYQMPGAPAYYIDPRVKITYLLDDIPNRESFREAINKKEIPAVIREGFRAVKILILKRTEMIKAIKNIQSGIVVATRDEHAVMLSRFGSTETFKVMQLHQDHNFEPCLVRHFAHAYGHIDVFSLLSPKMAEECREIMKENQHTKVMYIPNFTEVIPPEPDYSKKEKTVIAVGRLHPVKGFDRLIDSFARIHESCPDWQLDIIGDGEEFESLKKRIEENSAQGFIRLCGRYSPDEVAAANARASLYVMSSYTEGFPFVHLEAMCGALPIVALNTRGGLDMTVHNGENGILVQNMTELEQALHKLMHDDALRQRMAENSYKLVQEFSRENIAQTWFDIFEEHYHEEHRK